MTENKNYRLDDLKTPQQRIAAWCDWFNVPMPEFQLAENSVLLSDNLNDWLNKHSVNKDWILEGIANAKTQLRL